MTEDHHKRIENLPIDSDLLARLEQCTNLPSPPVVAMRIIELSNDPNVDIGKVADVISMDPALTAKVMRISNSPIYALRRRTDNLHQAITLLGLNGTLTLALSFSLAATMNNNACQGFDYNHYWRRSLATATCSRRIGMARRLRKGEELFLAGLLQDIGMLVIDKLDPDFYMKLGAGQDDHVQLAASERQQLGADHALIGAWILLKWGMPEYLVDSVMYSHDVEVEQEDEQLREFMNCTSLAGPLVDAVHAEDESRHLHEVSALIKSRLGFSDGQFDEMMASMNEDFQEAGQLFETDLSNYSFSDSLIDRAKEALILKNIENMQKTQRLQETTEILQSKTEQLEERSRRDGLTGLFNRAYLDKRIEREFSMARKRDWPMIVMFVDLDHFKQVNDTHGHQAGDQVLQRAASALVEGTREEDTVARYGGEEFIVLAPGQGLDTAKIIADRLVRKFRELTHVTPAGMEINVTASIGVSVLGETTEFSSVKEMVAAADKALYMAKETGRNRYVIYTAEMEDDTRLTGT